MLAPMATPPDPTSTAVPQGLGRRLLLLLIGALGLVGVAWLSLQALPSRKAQSWPVSQGRVTVTRTRTKQIHDARGGRVAALEAEVLVTYRAAGKTYIRWFSLPARSTDGSDQVSDLSPHMEGALCNVHWKQDHPFEAFVTEYPAY